MSKLQLFYWKPGDGENFGDSLGPVIVNAMIEYAHARSAAGGQHIPRKSLDVTHDPRSSPKLLSIGSVAHYARDGDTIWGTGVRNEREKPLGYPRVRLLAARGRLSAELLQHKAEDMSYGDPAMLLPYLASALEWPHEYQCRRPPKTGRTALLPNLRQLAGLRGWRGYPWRGGGIHILSPYLTWPRVLRGILESDFVVATSLHGLILAEAFGVPVVWLSSPPLEEGTFKIRDYLSATERSAEALPKAASVPEALEMKQELVERTLQNGAIRPKWDPRPLWNAFPWAMFQLIEPGFPGARANRNSELS